MATTGRTSLLRRSLSNVSGLPATKDHNNHSNISSINPFGQPTEPGSQRPRLFSAPLEPTASIVAEITAAFEENRVASPKVPPPSRSWSQRELPSDPEKVKQLIELFSGRTRQGSAASRSATDLSVTERERRESSLISPGAGRVTGSESSVGGPSRSTRRSSPVRSYPEPRRWALKSPIPIRDPSPTPIRDVYSPTLPSALTSPRTDVSIATRPWERASIDISKGRTASQPTVNGSKPLEGVGKVTIPVASRPPSPKQLLRIPTPTSPLVMESNDREARPTSPRANNSVALVSQNMAVVRSSQAETVDHIEPDKLENIPKVARKYLERVNKGGSHVSHQRRSHHSPSPFFSTSPHEFSRPRAYKLKSPKYVVEPRVPRHQTDSDGSRSRFSPNPEYGSQRNFASPSPKLYAGNLPEWIRGVQPPPFKVSHPPTHRISATDMDDRGEGRLHVPPIGYDGVRNDRIGDVYARSSEDSQGISTAMGRSSPDRLSPGANNGTTAIMYGTSMTSQPAPPLASPHQVKVHQYGRQNQLKSGKAGDTLERLAGDGVFEYDSPGELYTDRESEATLAELATVPAMEMNTSDYISPEPPPYFDGNMSRDFHHFVNAPPPGYKPSQIPIQIISKPSVAPRMIQRGPIHSSPPVLHMPPFLPPDSPIPEPAFRNQNNYNNFRGTEESTTGSSHIHHLENEFAGFSDNSLRSSYSTRVDMNNRRNSSFSSTFENSRRGSFVGRIGESYEEEVLMNYPPSCAHDSQCSTSTTTLAQSIRQPLLKHFASLRRKAAKKAELEVESNGNNDGTWDERDSFWVRMLEGKWVSDV